QSGGRRCRSLTGPWWRLTDVGPWAHDVSMRSIVRHSGSRVAQGAGTIRICPRLAEVTCFLECGGNVAAARSAALLVVPLLRIEEKQLVLLDGTADVITPVIPSDNIFLDPGLIIEEVGGVQNVVP